MSQMQRLMPKFVATVVGVVSGVYIFAPTFQDAAQSARAEQLGTAAAQAAAQGEAAASGADRAQR
ncbi:hypothetical protein MSPP1_003627 [Malassezia sp. CBS 17886]|nr:hypothetical protein MSPP1_003627 [Malassezia sp. CBS 17886]